MKQDIYAKYSELIGWAFLDGHDIPTNAHHI